MTLDVKSADRVAGCLGRMGARRPFHSTREVSSLVLVPLGVDASSITGKAMSFDGGMVP